jgi:hypothetical protein
MIQQVLKPIQRVIRWFFGAPFQQLPPEFGETVPPDLQAFEANAEAAQHHPRGHIQSSNPGDLQQPRSYL